MLYKQEFKSDNSPQYKFQRNALTLCSRIKTCERFCGLHCLPAPVRSLPSFNSGETRKVTTTKKEMAN